MIPGVTFAVSCSTRASGSCADSATYTTHAPRAARPTILIDHVSLVSSRRRLAPADGLLLRHPPAFYIRSPARQQRDSVESALRQNIRDQLSFVDSVETGHPSVARSRIT